MRWHVTHEHSTWLEVDHARFQNRNNPQYTKEVPSPSQDLKIPINASGPDCRTEISCKFFLQWLAEQSWLPESTCAKPRKGYLAIKQQQLPPTPLLFELFSSSAHRIIATGPRFTCFFFFSSFFLWEAVFLLVRSLLTGSLFSLDPHNESGDHQVGVKYQEQRQMLRCGKDVQAKFGCRRSTLANCYEEIELRKCLTHLGG